MRRRNAPILLWALCFTVAALVALTPPAGSVPLHPQVRKSAPLPDLQSALEAGLDRPAARTARLPANAVVLLVDFADEPHAGNLTRAELEQRIFGASESVRDYYARSSNGRYVPAGVVSAWVRLPQHLAYYADGRRGIGGAYPRNARRMVEDAVRAADGAIDFSQFDDDGPDGIPSSGDDDGQVDALLVVHAGAGAEISGQPGHILSHSWFTETPVRTADGPLVWNYATISESSPLGVRAHEYGHLLGLPDLYDRLRGTLSASGGLGDWSLMASGAWLGNGHQPGDLDAPSKIELGFVDPLIPTRNADALPLAAGGATQAHVYQVWTQGRIGSEYFVIENRRPSPTGLDVLLPAGGMLVYHVDRSRATNDDPDHLRVRLMQADGRADLQSFRNGGDSGDPYPGTGVECCRIDADTSPSTRASDGSETQVEISAISDPAALMTFNLQIESRPDLRVQQHALRETDGDGDGFPEAGEELELVVVIENRGLASLAFDVEWRSEPAQGTTWSVARTSLPGLGKGESASASFFLRPAPDLGDPHTLDLHADVIAQDGYRQELHRQIVLGERGGFDACFEAVTSSVTRDCSDPVGAWSVEALRGDAGWSLEPRAGELSLVWRSARGPRYPNDVDVVLVSPPFNLEPESELHLLHDWSIEDFDAGWSHDGGRVEIAMHGGAWEPLKPRGGYPRRLFPESVPYLAEQGVFAGNGTRRWDLFDLGPRAGSARVRFRFVSNDSIAAAGWSIVRVQVRSAGVEAITQRSAQVIAEPNPVRFPARVAFRLVAARNEAAQPTRLRLFDARGRLVRTFQHATLPAQSGRFLWDGMDHAGRLAPAGVYFARLEWGGEAATTKLLVIR
jgi:immune inhibitor A